MRHSSEISHVGARQRVDRMRISASRQPALDPLHDGVSAFPGKKSPSVFERHHYMPRHNLGSRGWQSSNGKTVPALSATLIVERRPALPVMRCNTCPQILLARLWVTCMHNV
jgi:hypothetical protein